MLAEVDWKQVLAARRGPSRTHPYTSRDDPGQPPRHGAAKLGFVSCVRSAPHRESHPSPAVGARHSRSSIVRFANGPKKSIRRILGPKKNSNLFRGADGPKWSAAPAESCQSAAQRSPGARFMMVLDVGRRLDACAGASIGRDISVQVLSQASGLGRNPPSFAFRALWDPQAPAHAV